MSVLLETTRGDVVVDLHAALAPRAAENFLKLCRLRYYDGLLFHCVQRGFAVQAGCPAGTGRGGESVHGLLHGPSRRFFADEVRPGLRHDRPGLLGMAAAGKNQNGSQFYITTGAGARGLDGRTIFGEVVEGMDTVLRIDAALCDDAGRPWQNIRIKRTHILDDPFPDPPGLAELVPERSEPPELGGSRMEDDWEQREGAAPGAGGEEARGGEVRSQEREARSRAAVLEMIGDMPDAEAAPEKNMIFVCKLNSVTQEEDLEIIFSRFGKVTACDIIRDWKTGESLSYGFVGFETNAAAETAYLKMNNCLIDDRRIHVDFYQSMHHQWRTQRRGGAGRGGGGRGGGQGVPGGAAVVRSFEELQRRGRGGALAPAGGREDLRRQHLELGGSRGGRGVDYQERHRPEYRGRDSRESREKTRHPEDSRHRGNDWDRDGSRHDRHVRERSRHDDRYQDRDEDRGRGGHGDRGRDQDRGRGRDRGRDRSRDRDWDRDRGRDQDRDRGRHGDRGQERKRNRHDGAERGGESPEGQHRGHRRRRHRSNHRRHDEQ